MEVKGMGLKKITYGTNALVIALLVAGILALVNAISYRHFFRIDLTDSQQFTISPSTKKVLADLDDLVNIKVYLSKNLPPYLMTVTDHIRDILTEYRIYSDGKIAIEYIDPAEDPATQQRLRFMGIPQLRLNIVEKDKAAIADVYMGLAVLYGDSKEIIPALTDVATFEYELTSKILRATTQDVQTVGFLSGHGGPELRREYATIDSLLKERYFTREVTTAAGEKIPADIAALVIAGPKEMTERDVFEVDQYLMAGGHILFLVDTVDIQPRGLTATALPSPVADLLRHYGVSVPEELVLDQLNVNASFQSGMFNIFVPYPFWVRVVRQGSESHHPIVSGIESMVLPWASPLVMLEDRVQEKTVDILARSSPYSWTQKGSFDLNPRQDFHPAPDQLRPRVMAVALSGSFTSYFAGRDIPPAATETDADEKIGPRISDATRTVISESPETKIIVIGSSRFIAENFAEEFEGNRTFFQNAVDWFIIGDKLIDIRSREAGERPLKIIADESKSTIKATNMISVPVLLAVFGLVQFLLRRRRKLRGAAL
jgi:gliding-associated putative ABC transporter substrate-binding component GldG